MNGNAAGNTQYRGRFAPSPTGPLHFGSLIAALASYLQARANNGEWLVRIEDIDPTREQPEASDQILRSLENHGFEFAPPLYQSSQLDQYASITDALIKSGKAYPCSCTRKHIRATATDGIAGPVYPGTCRNGADTSARPATSVRLRVSDNYVEFTDQLQGNMHCQPDKELGDFLIRRGDGLVAYQLAVVVDDEAQNITEIVRGTDLLEPTFMQLVLQHTLGYRRPDYLHIPVATGADGQKLSKQTGATALDENSPSSNLLAALSFLNQNIDKLHKSLSCNEILRVATTRWNPDILRGVRTLPIGV